MGYQICFWLFHHFSSAFLLSNHKTNFPLDFLCKMQISQRILNWSLSQRSNFYSRWPFPKLYSTELWPMIIWVISQFVWNWISCLQISVWSSTLKQLQIITCFSNRPCVYRSHVVKSLHDCTQHSLTVYVWSSVTISNCAMQKLFTQKKHVNLTCATEFCSFGFGSENLEVSCWISLYKMIRGIGKAWGTFCCLSF